jgi:hypothetical protein
MNAFWCCIAGIAAVGAFILHELWGTDEGREFEPDQEDGDGEDVWH